jgi:hypothetical protein
MINLAYFACLLILNFIFCDYSREVWHLIRATFSYLFLPLQLYWIPLLCQIVSSLHQNYGGHQQAGCQLLDADCWWKKVVLRCENGSESVQIIGISRRSLTLSVCMHVRRGANSPWPQHAILNCNPSSSSIAAAESIVGPGGSQTPAAAAT